MFPLPVRQGFFAPAQKLDTMHYIYVIPPLTEAVLCGIGPHSSGIL